MQFFLFLFFFPLTTILALTIALRAAHSTLDGAPTRERFDIPQLDEKKTLQIDRKTHTHVYMHAHADTNTRTHAHTHSSLTLISHTQHAHVNTTTHTHNTPAN